jgi:hypothetical protein
MEAGIFLFPRPFHDAWQAASIAWLDAPDVRAFLRTVSAVTRPMARSYLQGADVYNARLARLGKELT